MGQLRVYAETNRHLFTKATEHGWDTVQVKSKSNPNVSYTVDVTLGRCSCPAWKFQKGGDRKPCKHLLSLGFKQVMPNIVDFKEKNSTPVNQQLDYEFAEKL